MSKINRRDFLLGGAALLGATVKGAPVRSLLANRDLIDNILMPTAADYILDGLVFFWDSIENVGFGERDPDATVWTDLINGVELSLCQQASFTDDGLVISATDDNISTAYITRPHSTTAEIAARYMGTGRTPYSCTCAMNIVAAQPVKDGTFLQFSIND